MTDKKQKLTLVISLIAAFALGMATVSGCAYFTGEKVSGTASTVLEIAYAAGGASMVGQKIDQMAADGKITPEQAVLLKAAAQKSYDDLQKKLKELSVADVEVTVTK